MIVAALSILVTTPAAMAQGVCPTAEELPLLTIDRIEDPAVPVVDKWQVMFSGVPLSDAQIAALGRDDPLIDVTRAEMERRGTWVYIGMATAAAGTALSSVGWLLFGQNDGSVPEALSLTMAVGGILIGGAGTLLVTESIQSPLEPHLAPTPRHRLTRDQVRLLVARTNQRFYSSICRAVEQTAQGQAPATKRRPSAVEGASAPDRPAAEAPAKSESTTRP
jgi:hypothetical protein